MSDMVKYDQDLRFEVMFVDGDTRTFSVKNPRSNISQSDIASLNAYMQNKAILIGDKYGGRFGKISDARTVRKTTTYLDLE